MLKPKYYLYARKSTEDDDHQIMSIEAQLFELREFAKREGIEIVRELTESKSAKKPGREKFGELVDLIEKSEGVGILAWHPDRLARNSVDGGKIIYLVDQKKIVSLRFPTFWFEPTPQGLFMLQVAFGQSKYYSDNLVENITRGFRQKLRRGEWLTLAPFGYVNNPRTRNIEPDSLKRRIVVRAFEEFATGKRGYESLAEFLADLGVTGKHGRVLPKSTVHRILTSKVYLGMVTHKGEWFSGKHEPILSPQLFEAVQKVLAERSHPRRSKVRHDFPFLGLLRCGECDSAITAQWATGRSGGRYRYYRCTKKQGVCNQSYLRENLLAGQLKEKLQKVALSDEWAEKWLSKVSEWEKETAHSSETFARKFDNSLREVEAKLDKLVTAYLDEDIPRDVYLKRKEVLLLEKAKLVEQNQTFGQTGKNWIEPLRRWILDAKKATEVALSEKYEDVSDLTKKVGTNPVLFNKSVSFSYISPWDLLAGRRAGESIPEMWTVQDSNL